VLEKLKQTLLGRKETGPFRVPGQITDETRILALASSDLADLVFHAPMLAAIRRRWPGANIDFLVPEQFAPLIIPSGMARQVMVYTEKQLSGWKPAFRNLQRTLAGGKYDVSFVLTMEPSPALESLALASGAVLRCGPSHSDSWPAVNLELRGKKDEPGYVGDHTRILAPFLGLESHHMPTAWPLPLDKLRQVAQLVHFNKPRPEEILVGIDPGPDRDGRALSADNLLFLVQQLRTQLPCRILPLGVPGSEDRLAQLEAGLTSPIPPAFNRDTLLETVLLLYQCDLFLAGNTDLFHMAVAENVPTIGLFGKHVEARWHPQDRRRCTILPVAKGEKVDIATLMDAVQSVRRSDDDDTPDFERQSGPVDGPLPAPGS